jgi:glucose-6-phosphate isomerase
LNLFRQRIVNPAALPAFEAARARAGAALKETLAQAARGKLHALTICEEAEDLAPARALAERLRGEAEHILLLGVGGSSLGAQAIAQLKGFATPLQSLPAPSPRLHIIDNLDAPTYGALLKGLPLARTALLAISKSGATAETLTQVLTAIAAIEAEGDAAQISRRLIVVTEAKPSPLRRLAEERGAAILDHPNDIGGRFSGLSVVGLLPALLIGLDAAKVRAGAARAWGQAKSSGTAAIEGAAFAVAGAEATRPISVLMPYSDRLERFALWYRQLWAESLGKNGKGTLPVRALGPVDQHSQLQLYLGGPNNAVFTIMTDAQEGRGPRVPAAMAPGELSYLAGRTMGDLVAAEARATWETLAAHGRPVRIIETGALDEERLGALFLHFMLETILSARMIGVDAFDQPAVEEGKLLAKRYLSEAPKA